MKSKKTLNTQDEQALLNFLADAAQKLQVAVARAAEELSSDVDFDAAPTSVFASTARQSLQDFKRGDAVMIEVDGDLFDGVVKMFTCDNLIRVQVDSLTVYNVTLDKIVKL